MVFPENAVILLLLTGNAMTPLWINIHTHKPGEGINIVDPCLGEVVSPAKGKMFYSMGIHPMYIDEKTERKLAEIEKAASEKRIVAVGECGLDRNSEIAIGLQQDLFARQAEIAGKYDLPLIIHGVRAIPELITVYKRCCSHQKWIMHGFNNRREILTDLLAHDFYISVGRQVMNEESQVFRLLPEIPAERLFIETDNSDYPVEAIYRQVAGRRGIEVSDLQEIIAKNFREVFVQVLKLIPI